MAETIKGDPLNKGQYYTKKELGIDYPLSLKGKVETKEKEEELLFITIHNDEKYQNELHHDGVVHQADLKLADYGVNNYVNEKPMHVFVRFFQEGQFLYLGELEYVVRYDINRNKLFIKGIHSNTVTAAAPGNKI